MVKRQIFDCDKCGKEDLPVLARLSVFKERYTDAAGSRDSDYAELELCTFCCQKVLQYLEDKVTGVNEALKNYFDIR